MPFNATARTAGVSQGVLYRHFPDRMDLVLAVFEENTMALEDLAADPGTSLGEVLDFVTDQVIESVAFVDMVNASTNDHRVDRVAHRLADALADKLGPAQELGDVRSDLTGDDLLMAIGMIANLVAKVAPSDRRAAAAQAWQLMWQGLLPR